MNSLHTVRRGEKFGTINEILEEQGCIVIENMLDDAGYAALEDRIRPLLDATAPCQGNFYGFATKRLSGLIAKSKACRQMSIEPHILAVMDEFLLRSCRAYQLSLTQAIQIGPGEPQQLIHADDLMFSFEHPGREAMINCMWAVDDFTKENGATLLVPGSHQWSRDRAPEPHEITQGEMRKGSVLIYFGSLLHAGGANRTDTAADRCRDQLLPRLAAPGGKPVSRRAAGYRAGFARRAATAARLFRARTQSRLRRGPGPDPDAQRGTVRRLAVSGVHPEGGAAAARRTPRENAGCLNNFRGPDKPYGMIRYALTICRAASMLCGDFDTSVILQNRHARRSRTLTMPI